MLIEIRVPQLGESVAEATVGNWLKQPGAAVAEGDVLVELETDKVLVEVPASEAGVIAEILQASGAIVGVGDVLCKIDPDARAARQPEQAAPAEPASGTAAQPERPASRPAPEPSSAAEARSAAAAATRSAPQTPAAASLTPSARRMVAEHGLEAGNISGSGRHGQVTKGDVIDFMERSQPRAQSAATPAAEQTAQPRPQPADAARPQPATPRPTRPGPTEPGERETRVKMSRLRQRIAERLVEAQQTAAILTTFNEVDMTAVMELRGRYKESFQSKHGVALGFMSFFAKACIEALRAFPAVNAEIQGDEIVYKHYYDIGLAVGTERGLVVPIVRDAHRKRFIEIELELAELAKRAREGKLTLEELTGGTFTISNGGVYGSMLSTPILNPPQSGILGMHNIVKRPVVVNDQIVARPMMYLALSYDHRLIDGREAVQFLVRVKQVIEDPARMLLEI
jgi:2-oxoglutarate dehydrogenase E2 component (dihydrolipoamide succinyltransferase)